MTHTLEAAVNEGYVYREAAAFGLNTRHILDLSAADPYAIVLVHFKLRSYCAIVSVAVVAEAAHDPKSFRLAGFTYYDIQNITAAAIDERTGKILPRAPKLEVLV